MTPAQMELFYKAAVSMDAQIIEQQAMAIGLVFADDKGRNKLENALNMMHQRVKIDLLKED